MRYSKPKNGATPQAKSVAPVYKACHTGVIPVLSLPNTTLYGGAWRDAKYAPMGFRFRFMDTHDVSSAPAAPIRANAEAQALLPKEAYVFKPTPQVEILWPDFGVPDLDPYWWALITEWALSDAADLPKKISVSCTGGHGRTGTALSILAALSGKAEGEDPVQWVRNRYCHNAVESYEQIDYIEWITGEPIFAEPSEVYRAPSNYGLPYGSSSGYGSQKGPGK